ncbi:MAG: hypothetical protein WCO51_10720 [bacterium]
MITGLPHNDYIRLSSTLRHSLVAALKTPTQAEPQLVANMVCEIPNAINALKPLGSVEIKADGVFVHGQPFVEYIDLTNQSQRRVEIGDLLLLRTEVQNKEVIERSALLLQAKKNSGIHLKPDSNQHYLYANWPEFKYVRSTSKLNGQNRKVLGMDLYNACKYLLIGGIPFICPRCPGCPGIHSCYFHSSLPWHCTLTAQPSLPKLSLYRCFLNELISFVLGDAGKPFVFPPPNQTIGWDKVIWDLIDVTAEQASEYMRRASSNSKSFRGSGDCFFVRQQMAHSLLDRLDVRNSFNGNEPPDVPDEWLNEDELGGGISIIEFVVSSEGVG